MQVLALTYYNAKRLSRYKALWAALFTLPLAVALIRSIFASSSFILTCTRACPFVCAAFVCIALIMQNAIDSTSGFSRGLRSTPVSRNIILASRLLTGFFIFIIQMAILSSILALRF